MADAQRPATGGWPGLLGYLVVEADIPDGSFAYVAYDDVVYRTKAEAWATVTDEAMEQRRLRVVAIVETAHWEAALHIDHAPPGTEFKPRFEDTQEWAEATAPAAQEAWDDSIGLGPDEAVHEAAASAALAGVPVSEEWKAKVRAALDQDDPDAALDAVVAREIREATS